MLLGEKQRHVVEQNLLHHSAIVIGEKDQWVQRLRIATVKQAADDLRLALRSHDEGAVKALCRWFNSEWGQLLCFGYGRIIVSRIIKEEEEREQNET